MADTLTCTWSTDERQVPFVISQLKTYVPGINPVMVVFGELLLVITAALGPLACVHVPVPTAGLLAAIVAVAAQIV